jgi:8-oxo-dGTP diphosphatase
MSSVTRYVAGFLFDPKGELVLLIEKKRPEWMAGKWNGVGGRIGAGETPLQAMARKGEEETGLSPETHLFKWEHFATLNGRDFEVEFFSAFSDVMQFAMKKTDEVVRTFYVANLAYTPSPLVSNLPVLIALALDRSGIRKPVYLQDDSPPQES